MVSYHIHNSDFMNHVGRPSGAKKGDKFTLPDGIKGFTGPGCRGSWDISIPAGEYKIISRKYFVGGTQEIAPA